MDSKIPTAYLEIVKRFQREADFDGKILTARARFIMGQHYHFPRESRYTMILEMEKLGLIKLDIKWVWVLWKEPKEPDS